MPNSKQKGARYEREIAAKLREYGYDARRTAQYCGNSEESADVVGLPFVHIECKHYANKAFDYAWMEQAIRDAKGKIAWVVHRTDRHPNLVTMTLEDAMMLYQSLEKVMMRIGEFLDEE